MTTEKTCFIIMPVTTTKEMVETYNDPKHFEHVLKLLFIPAIEATKYKPIPPISEGSDIIHANIITNLNDADMVLCDLSTFNPNVFFELGIRTSLNKPVCIVKDDHTPKAPFDIGLINNQDYQSGIMAWVLEDEKKKLTDHFLASVKRSKDKNTMWNTFNITNQATVPTGEISKDDKLDYLTVQMNTIQKQLADQLPRRYSQPSAHDESASKEDISGAMAYLELTIPPTVKHGNTMYDRETNRIIISYAGEWDGHHRANISDDIRRVYGIKVGYQPL